MSAHDVPGMSRRRFLGASAAGIGAASVAGLAACGGGSRARAASTAAASTDLADAVLQAFQTHRLVGLGEAHGIQNHHDMLDALLNDPRIPAVVDDIVIEFGNALYQPTIDRFIAGRPVNNVDLRLAWRNTTQSPAGTWDQPVYEQFFRTVRAVNWTLPADQQIRVLLGDPPIDWSKVTNRRELLVILAQRDTHPASVIEKQVLAKGHRALLCYGAEHLLHNTPDNITSILEHKTGEQIWTIADLTYLAGDPGGLAKSLEPYPRNTVIPTAGTWLGAFDAGLIYASPSGMAKGGRPAKAPTPANPLCGVRVGSLHRRRPLHGAARHSHRLLVEPGDLSRPRVLERTATPQRAEGRHSRPRDLQTRTTGADRVGTASACRRMRSGLTTPRACGSELQQRRASRTFMCPLSPFMVGHVERDSTPLTAVGSLG